MLFYLCGHFNRPGEQDPFVAALDDIRQVGGSAAMSAAVYLDLESGAQRIALRHGEPAESEFLGAVNSGDPETLEQFLAVGVRCVSGPPLRARDGGPRHHGCRFGGRPAAVRCRPRCSRSATTAPPTTRSSCTSSARRLQAAFPADGSRRLVLLACDMYAMQFMEVAYELRGVLDLMLGIQPDDRQDAAPLVHWPYARCLRRWQEIVATPIEGAPPRWRSAVDPQGLILAKETVALLAEHYASAQAGPAGHGLGDQPGGARPGCAGARHLQRGVPPVAEQRRHLACARKRREGPHECPGALVELRPR